MNNFLPKMSVKVFNKLHDRFQIPSHIPLRLSGKKEKCYSGRTSDVSFYESVFVVGLRLPFIALHRQLVNYLGISIS